MLLREATSETYGPRVYSHHINLHYFNIVLLLLFTLHLYTKNTKNIISIRSHSRKWLWRAWQPLIALVASSYRFVRVRGTWAWAPTGLIPWFSKTKGNTYATLPNHPFLFKGKPTHAQEVARRISSAVAGEIYAQVKTYQVPITNSYPSHYIICHLPLVFLSPTSPLSFYSPSLSQSPLFSACLLLPLSFACLFSVCSC